ncbi:MAG: hypothetical protein Fur0041_17110 [Bacteroidia bacterium]
MESIKEHKDIKSRKAEMHFDEKHVIHELKHYLPAQAPLKDFIHHNTLHAFQSMKFNDALRNASRIFGYKVSLTLDEYRELYASGRISDQILNQVITSAKGYNELFYWKEKLLKQPYDVNVQNRIGRVRNKWRDDYKIDLDNIIQPELFRIICSYLDQGISIWNFPVHHKGFLTSIREIERNSFSSFFKTKRARTLLLENKCGIEQLLKILVGDPTLYEHYLFDQQFAHQGWSGMVSTIEDFPQTLIDHRSISLHDIIVFELLLEIDALDHHFGTIWAPLGTRFDSHPGDLFEFAERTELDDVFYFWQLAFEWSYYDQVLAGIQQSSAKEQKQQTTFQALFCLDDRECSLRRYLEEFDPHCRTFGTPGFFGVEFYFQPENGKSITKLCPAPVTPRYLIKEAGSSIKNGKDVHFTRQTHNLFGGWLISQTLGFWSAFKLFLNLFRPTISPAAASSLRHMDKYSRLTIENTHADHKEHNLQVGFTVDEMAVRVENLLRSIGLVKDFAPIVYVVGHGASSVNNPHFSAYDCGACSGRPGSVNARVFCHMANHPKVRTLLRERGIDIPESTQFVGGLHDTTRDDVVFYDEDNLNPENKQRHQLNESVFSHALDYNAKERSRRFELINTSWSAEKIHEKVRKRSISLFEPRPELNHATNALCIVGRRELTKGLFLDRRSFLNSFDYRVDPEGIYLLNILKAAAPVCGGINLEYFFSRVDNQKLGAGSKLPHNVMGLFGVANGIDGDLRPGLPSQMIEVHDPIRLMIIVEHFPDVVLQTIQKSPETYEWFINEWVHLAVVHPETKELYYFSNGEFSKYKPLTDQLGTVDHVAPLIESSQENFPVYLIKNKAS